VAVCPDRETHKPSVSILYTGTIPVTRVFFGGENLPIRQGGAREKRQAVAHIG